MENSPPASPGRTSYVFAPVPTSGSRARKASDPASPGFFSGSSFKPLHLTHLPWVSAYLRADQREGRYPEFRLPFIVQHAHLQGNNSFSYPNSPSLPPTRQIPVLDKRTASDPNINTHDIESESRTPSPSSPNDEQAQAEQNETDCFSGLLTHIDGPESSEPDAFESSQNPANGEQGLFDIQRPAIENQTPSESQPSTPISPSPGTPRRSSTRRRRLRGYNNTVLPITAFQSELIGQIAIAEDAFGY